MLTIEQKAQIVKETMPKLAKYFPKGDWTANSEWKGLVIFSKDLEDKEFTIEYNSNCGWTIAFITESGRHEIVVKEDSLDKAILKYNKEMTKLLAKT